jgi:uncharacterized membrane protein
MQKRGMFGFLIGLLMPHNFALGGAGLAAIGLTPGSLALTVEGLIVAAAGVLRGVITLDLTSPFYWF